MPWCRLEASFAGDFKIRALARTTGHPLASAHGWVACLYSWAVTNAPDGHIGSASADDMAAACLAAELPPAALLDALLAVGIIDEDATGYTIHGYARRAASYREARRKTASRTRTPQHPGRARDGVPDAHAMASRTRTHHRHQERRGERGDLGEEILVPVPSRPTQMTHDPRSIPAEVSKKQGNPRRKRLADGSPAAQPSGVAQVRSAWIAAHRDRYGADCTWGARSNGQAAALLREWPLARVLELVPLYFAWRRPEPVRAGHPFGLGPHSFAMRLRELDADTVAPERRAAAAEIRAHESAYDANAAQAAQAARVDQLLAAQRATGDTDGTETRGSDAIAPVGDATSRGTRPPAVGRGTGAVGLVSLAVRGSPVDLGGDDSGVRGREDAVDRGRAGVYDREVDEPDRDDDRADVAG